MNSKLLIGLIIVSISINLLLVGFILGNKSRPYANFDPARGFAPWIRTLPEERQAELRPLVRSAFKGAAPFRLGKLHREFRAALIAEPFDRKTAAATLAQIRQGHQHRQTASHEAFIELAMALSLSERQALHADLEREPRRHRPPRRDSPHREH